MILSKSTLDYLENRLIEELSKVPDFQNKRINSSPRAVGDTVQGVIGEVLPRCFPPDTISEFSSDFSRRAMADVSFNDADGNYFAVDIKTHNVSTAFNMPNLTSVQRLAKFYKESTNYFAILLVEYKVENDKLVFTGVCFVPIEHLEWSCLTLGALGWGQIQIANSNKININRNNTRADWMLELCRRLNKFYTEEIKKNTDRRDYFQKLQNELEGK
ncbi:MAG: hypothetical protein ACI4KM_08855 [Oscillospiraceae bacterium]